MKLTGLFNLGWVLATIACVVTGYVPGLLGIIALVLFDICLEIKLARKAVNDIAACLTEPPEDALQADDDAVAAIMKKLADDVTRKEFRH